MGALAAVAVAAALTGCGLGDGGTDLVNGKEQFVASCGGCHALDRAGTAGEAGPDLDASFARARIDGLGESTIAGVVRAQISSPNRNPSSNVVTGEREEVMPADLVTGDDAEDVAAYVASAVAVPGEDPGRLADVGAAEPEGTARAEGGTLEIPAVGAVDYAFGAAEAPPGALTITSPNESPAPHNIALEGGGVDEIGDVVDPGGTSEIQVDLEPGEYAFYCSVEGHRESGMEGVLTVARR